MMFGIRREAIALVVLTGIEPKSSIGEGAISILVRQAKAVRKNWAKRSDGWCVYRAATVLIDNPTAPPYLADRAAIPTDEAEQVIARLYAVARVSPFGLA